MSSAAILCVDCGAASPAAVPLCAKCGSKNARVCAGCGFQNSLAKNYCDKCGNPISELGDIAPPTATAIPGSPKAEIPATIVTSIKESRQQGEPMALPAAKKQAAEPGAPLGAQLSAPSNLFSSAPVSNDPWAATAPAQPERRQKNPIWMGILRRTLTAAFATVAVLVSLLGAWYVNDHGTPENAARRAGVRYLEALRVHDYAAAYAQFSVAAKKNCTLEEFTAARDNAPWTWSNLSVERSEPGAILFAYDLKPEEHAPRVDHVLFIEENKDWVRPYNKSLMRKVEDAFNKNNPDQGLTLAQTAASIDTRDPRARAYLCEAAYYRKTPVDTERQCSAALELSNTYPSDLPLKTLYRLHAILGDTYKNSLSQPDRALDQFSQMLAFPDISPVDQCEILIARSESYIALSRPGEALADAERAAQLCVRQRDFNTIQELRRRLNAPTQ